MLETFGPESVVADIYKLAAVNTEPKFLQSYEDVRLGYLRFLDRLQPQNSIDVARELYVTDELVARKILGAF